jgi:hypothetical protein
MVGELQIIFGLDPVARKLRIARKVAVFLDHLGRIAACAAVDAVGLVDTAASTGLLAVIIVAVVVAAATATALSVVHVQLRHPDKLISYANPFWPTAHPARRARASHAVPFTACAGRIAPHQHRKWEADRSDQSRYPTHVCEPAPTALCGGNQANSCKRVRRGSAKAPCRGRRGRVGRSTENPAASASSRTDICCVCPISRTAMPCRARDSPRQIGDDPAIVGEPVGTGEERARGLMIGDVGHELPQPSAM